MKPGTLLKTLRDFGYVKTALTINGGLDGYRLSKDSIPIGTIVELIRINTSGSYLVWIPQYNIFIDRLGPRWYTPIL